MKNEEIIPSDKSSILIDRFLKIEVSEKKGEVNDKFIPDGHAGMIFHFGKPAEFYDGEKHSPLPNFFISKPFLGNLDIRVSHENDSIIAILNTSVLTRILNFSLEPYQKRSHFVKNFSFVEPLFTMLNEVSSFNDRASIISDYFSREIIPADYVKDEIDDIYFKILEEGGLRPINSILSEFNINPRTFRRNFIKRIGISAKGLSRIVRVNYFWKKILTISEQDFHNFIFECKYCDQAHFIKDFKDITGETPNYFFNRDLSVVKLVSGI